MSIKKLFCGGVKEDTTEDQLKDYFSKFGIVDGVDIKRGFAFVMFDDYDVVDKLVCK